MKSEHLDPKELREEGAKELFDSLQPKYPDITIEECYDIYDKMMIFYEEHKVLRRIKDEGENPEE